MASLNQLSVPLRQKGFYNCTKTWYIFLLSVAWLAYQLCPTTNKLFKISISKTFFSINILVVQFGSNFKGTRHVFFLHFLTHWLMLRSSISLFATHAVLRVVLKPENISLPYASFVSMLPLRFLLLSSNHFSRCLDHCFRSFWSLEHWSYMQIILYSKLFICCLFWYPWVALKDPFI